MALNEEWGRRCQYFYIKSVFFLALCVVRISMFICFDTICTRAGKIRLTGTNRKTRDKHFEKPKEWRSKTQNDSHLHMHVKQTYQMDKGMTHHQQPQQTCIFFPRDGLRHRNGQCWDGRARSRYPAPGPHSAGCGPVKTQHLQ